ncbi:MAG: hypothetical protein P8080_09020 [Gammaproteobacteria bacterium]
MFVVDQVQNRPRQAAAATQEMRLPSLPVSTAGVAPVLAWLAAGVLATAALRLAGPAGELALQALAGTAALVYLGTAVISGRPGVALLDLATAALVVGLAAGTAVNASTVMMVHVLWGILRGPMAPAGSGRTFTSAWSLFFAAVALLAGLSA